jgi:predicted aconitase with swiveling domain
MVLQGKGYSTGIIEAEALVARKPFGFFLGMDPDTGIIIDERHDLKGEDMSGKVFIYPFGRGSTGTPGIFMQAVKNGHAPAAIINIKSEPMIVTCAVLAEELLGVNIPIIDGFNDEQIGTIKTGDILRVDGEKGTIEVL